MEFQKIEILRSDGKNDKFPRFINRLSYNKIPGEIAPLRAYLHVSGSIAFEHPHAKSMNILKDYLVGILSSNPKIMRRADFFLASVWGAEKYEMIDLFKFVYTRNWPGNPDVSAFVFKEGVYQPDAKEIASGDTLIMLGVEEQFRRTTKSLDEYIQGCPKILGLCSI